MFMNLNLLLYSDQMYPKTFMYQSSITLSLITVKALLVIYHHPYYFTSRKLIIIDIYVIANKVENAAVIIIIEECL